MIREGMMRKLLLALLALPIVGIVLIIGCGKSPSAPDVAPTVTYEAIEKGSGLRLSWTALSGVDGYKVYVNGKEEWKGTEKSVDIFGPAKLIEVCGYTGDKDGKKWSLDLTPVITTITVYGRSDTTPAHPSGVGFNNDGDAITYALSDSANWPNLDFYIEDINNPGAPNPAIWSPHHRTYNTRKSGSFEESVTDLDDVDSAAAPGNYTTQKDLINGAVYSLFLDRDGDAVWDKTNSHFGKMKVLAISRPQVQLKIAFQKVPGYRMLVTK